MMTFAKYSHLFKIITIFVFISNTNLLANENMQLFLELIVNNQSSNQIAFIDYENQNYYVSEIELSKTKINSLCWKNAEKNENGKIAINRLPNFQVNYEQSLQQLFINVPANCLPFQNFYQDKQPQNVTKSSFGAIINYDLYAQKTKNHDRNFSIWNEARTFGENGIFSNTSIYRQNFDDENNPAKKNFIRYDTNWQFFDEKSARNYKAGDIITHPVAWSNAIRLGGIQVSRDFSLRPDIITYPLPEFSGNVNVPSSLELFINSVRQYETNVDPGSYSINSVPTLNGAGNAVIVVKDALGRQSVQTLPFYVTPDLLAPGFFDYTASFGKIRENYGQKNFDYKELVFDGSFRYGLNNYITLESHLENAENLFLGGLGIISRLNDFGVFNISYAKNYYYNEHYNKNENGEQASIGYQYVNNLFSINTKYTNKNENYRDLSALNLDNHLYKNSKQITLGFPLKNFGSMSAGYFATKSHNNEQTELINLSWNHSFNRLGTFFITANKSNQDKNYLFSLNWIMPINQNLGHFSTGFLQDPNKNKSYQFNYSHSAPSDGGIGFRFGYNFKEDENDDYRYVQLDWRNNLIKWQGGIYGEKNDETYWNDLSGSLIFMDKHFFATNLVNDAFVVISTDKVKNIPVKYENSLIGKTNKNGYLLIPWVPAYYSAKYEIDPMNLPLNIHAPIIEQQISLKRSSGFLLHFPLKTLKSVNIILKNENEEAIPMGSQVISSNNENTYVGFDGEVYLENVEQNETLSVFLPQGGNCTATIDLNKIENNKTILNIEPIICKMETDFNEKVAY